MGSNVQPIISHQTNQMHPKNEKKNILNTNSMRTFYIYTWHKNVCFIAAVINIILPAEANCKTKCDTQLWFPTDQIKTTAYLQILLMIFSAQF